MKNLVLLFLLLSSGLSFSGGFIFPNVEYDHARVYLFNTNKEAETKKPDFSVYQDGIFAYSKVGNGWEFTDQMNSEMNAIFKTGVDMLVSGLSGCYIPRHGIIYYDKVGKPVASLSICFECQRIYFWSSQKLPVFPSKVSEKQIPKAEKQMIDLETLFTRNTIPVYKQTDSYMEFTKTQKDLYENLGEIMFDYTRTPAFSKNDFTVSDVTSWVRGTQMKFKVSNETRFSQREGDTQSWDYTILLSNQNTTTKILFTDTTAQATLTEATIVDPEIKLPNGISTGMSLDNVQSTFQVWDGIAWPASIVVNYSDATLRYLFDHRTLYKIELVMH